MKKLNLNDFTTETTNELSKTDEGKKTRKPKEKLKEKMQVSLTESEYNKLYDEFERSGFNSFSAWCRFKLKEIGFI